MKYSTVCSTRKYKKEEIVGYRLIEVGIINVESGTWCIRREIEWLQDFFMRGSMLWGAFLSAPRRLNSKNNER